MKAYLSLNVIEHRANQAEQSKIKEFSMENVIIIGGGPAGLTSALYLGRAGYEPLVVEGINAGGQLVITTLVENYPGFPEGIEGPDLIENMRKQSLKFDAGFITGDVTAVNFFSSPFSLMVDDEIKEALAIIIATGSSSKWLGLESEKRLIGRGVTSCATCDAPFYKGKTVAIVGGGDTACEEALYLTRFAKKVYLIHRRNELRASKIMANRVIASDMIDIMWDSIVVEVLGDRILEGVKIQNTGNHEIKDLGIDGLFVAIGHTPNTAIFQGQVELDDNGYIKTENYVKTNISGVFACGDVADPVYKQAVTASGTGCMAALEAIKYLQNLRR